MLEHNVLCSCCHISSASSSEAGSNKALIQRMTQSALFFFIFSFASHSLIFSALWLHTTPRIMRLFYFMYDQLCGLTLFFLQGEHLSSPEDTRLHTPSTVAANCKLCDARLLGNLF